MKIIKILNKILIVIVVLLIIGLITLPFISKEDKNQGESKINNKEPKTTKKDQKILLTDKEVLDLLIIYKDNNHDFIIRDKTNNKYIIERKNSDTGNIDMIFEVNLATNDFKIVEIKPSQGISGGGSGE
ncbi:MAG: hypothetical protein PHD03_00445 [Bacilli bacterium]|nr:hypothetical protein [Bacilli bacterium]MDD4406630.1 hypothetical protein [Bacilli bacterium]